MDYKKLGLKVGLEIHQQLEGKKLFCNCPAEIIDTKPDYMIKRQLRAVVGETGAVDIAAAHEQKKGKFFIYNCYKTSDCLVEIDEEPPHPANEEALETALITAKLLNAQIIGEIHFMRKTVVDGSNVSGFQRTALIATDGYLETAQGRIHTPTICLEEDAAKIVEKTSGYDVYNLSRLGIPLIEIATSPDICSPGQARECAEKLGMILRSTNKVKRGIGTIRQDINISIKGGNRVEIKGAQDLKLISKLIENEVQRQKNIIVLKGKLYTNLFKEMPILKGKKADEAKENARVLCQPQILDSIFKNTKCNFIKNAIETKKDNSNNKNYSANKRVYFNGAVYGFTISGLNGKLGIELCPNHRVGTELSDYAKVKSGITGLIHSDEKLEKYNISKEEISNVKKELDVKESDAFIIIAADYDKCEKAYAAILERLKELNDGVPKEVRSANPDGTTSFLRPMPGAARMYPETDIPAITITKHMLSALPIPELIENKAERLMQYGLSKDLAQLLAKKHRVGVFEHFVKEFKNLKPAFIAEVMLPKIFEIKRKHNVGTEKITDKHLAEVFGHLNAGNISKDALEEIFVAIATGNIVDYSKYKTVSDKNLEKTIKEMVERNRNASFGALMGMIMAKYNGKINGKMASTILKKYLK